MIHASLIARVNFARFSAIGKIGVVPTTIPLAPPLRLQLGAFILAQDTRRLPQNRSFMSLAARKPEAYFGSLVPPPPHRPFAIFPPPPHQSIAMMKPRRAPMLVAGEGRPVVAHPQP